MVTQLENARTRRTDDSGGATAVSVLAFSDALAKVADQSLSDDPSRTEWAREYLREQRWRLLDDFKLIHREVERDWRILEVGACPFFFTAALHRLGYDVTGVDLGPERFRAYIEREHIEVVKCDIERDRFPLPSNGFRTVLLNEVFEHLRVDPIATLQEIHRVLDTGGLLILSTPNAFSLMAMWTFLHGRGIRVAQGSPYHEFHKLHELGHMGHIREYTVPEVTEFLTETGFRVDHVDYRGHYHATNKLHDLVVRLIPPLRQNFAITATKIA